MNLNCGILMLWKLCHGYKEHKELLYRTADQGNMATFQLSETSENKTERNRCKYIHNIETGQRY